MMMMIMLSTKKLTEEICIKLQWLSIIRYVRFDPTCSITQLTFV